jgi:hypothetical protein
MPLFYKAKYDAKILRRVKSQLYDMVKENKPVDKLYIKTDIEDDASEVDFVVGVGVYGKFGDIRYRGIKAEEVFRYVIGQSKREFNCALFGAVRSHCPYLPPQQCRARFGRTAHRSRRCVRPCFGTKR